MAYQGISFGSFSTDEISNLFIQETKDLQFVWQNNDSIKCVAGPLSTPPPRGNHLDIPAFLNQERRSYSPEILSPNIPPNPPTSPVEAQVRETPSKTTAPALPRKLNINAVPFVPGSSSSEDHGGVGTISSSDEAKYSIITTTASKNSTVTLPTKINPAVRELDFGKEVETLSEKGLETVSPTPESSPPPPLPLPPPHHPPSQTIQTTGQVTPITVTLASVSRNEDNTSVTSWPSYSILSPPPAGFSGSECSVSEIGGDDVHPLDPQPLPLSVVSLASGDSENVLSSSRAHEQAFPRGEGGVVLSPSLHPPSTATTVLDNHEVSDCHALPLSGDRGVAVACDLINSHSPSSLSETSDRHETAQTMHQFSPPAKSPPQGISSTTSPDGGANPRSDVGAVTGGGGAWGTNRVKSWASFFTDSGSPGTSQNNKLACQNSSTPVPCSRTNNQRVPDRGSNSGGVASKEEVSPCEGVVNGLTCKKNQKQEKTFRNTKENKHLKDLGEQLHHWKVCHKTTSIQPRGLINQGNWCYMHAPLQALLSIPSFLHLFQSLNTNPSLTDESSLTPFMDAMNQFVREFQDYPKTSTASAPTTGTTTTTTGSKKRRPHVSELLCGDPFRPEYLYSMLQKIRSNLSYKGRQEDAEELLGCILDGLHEEMLSANRVLRESAASPDSNEAGIPPESSHPCESTEGEGLRRSKDDQQEEEEEWEQVGPKNKSTITRQMSFSESPVTEVFGGRLRSALHRQGAKESATMEPFFSLQLDIQSDAITSVREALDALATKETVHMSEVDAYKRLTLARLPPVMIFHLKRFIFTSSGSQKLFKHIYYTMEMEIAKELLAPVIKTKLSLAQRTYRLWAVVYHHGKTATGGHYTCDVYHSGCGGWIRIDDSQLKPVPDDFVLKTGGAILNKNAYLLFYRRLDTLC